MEKNIESAPKRIQNESTMMSILQPTEEKDVLEENLVAYGEEKSDRTEMDISKKFLFMMLKPDVSRLNVVSLFLIAFMTSFIIYLKSSMISYLLVGDYNYTKQDSGTMAAKLGFYTDLGVLPSEFLFGTLFDMFGRKKFICAGMCICGITMIVITQFSEVYPWLVVFIVTLGISLIPAIISPLQVDYLLPQSMGASGAWISIFSLLGSTAGTSGALIILKAFNINTVFVCYGIFTILVGLFLCISIKEKFQPKNRDSSQKLKIAFKQFFDQLKIDKSLILVYLSNIATGSTIICSYQYGYILFDEEYENDQASQDFINSRLSTMTLISTGLTLPSIFILGYLLDRVKIWKCMLGFTLVFITALALFYKSCQNTTQKLVAGESGSLIQEISFVIILWTVNCQYQTQSTLMTKSLRNSDLSSGIAFGILGVSASVAVLTTDTLGAKLFKSEPYLPFILPISVLGVLALTIILLRLCKQINI